LPATRHRCNLDVWVLAQSHGGEQLGIAHS